MMKWLSVETEKNTVEHEDIKEEFFADSELRSEVISLARESIQNSIDAKLDNDSPVTVCFTISTQTDSNNSKYFGDLQKHLQRTFSDDTLSVNKVSKFLVIEDFNTTGLEGSIKSTKVEDEEFINKYGNSFWFFEWATGQSPKTSGGRGSWGVGKIVFAATSAIKTYLVFTSRRESRAPEAGTENITFGHSIQKYANLDGRRVKPERMWMNSDKEGSFVPHVDDKIISELKKDWRIKREKNEFGTSIVVPFIKEEMNISDLKICIMQDYFIAILDGTLICELHDEDGNITILDKDNLVNEIDQLSEAEITGNAQSKSELIAHCKLYEQSLMGETYKHILSQSDQKSNDWENIVDTSEDWQEIRTKLEAGQSVELEIQVNVPKRNVSGEILNGSFVVLLQKVEQLGISKSVFSRQGILISKANPDSKLRDYLSMVIVEASEKGKVLAQFLSDSEGPAHREWAQNTERFKKKYVPNSFANTLLRFVKGSVIQIGRLIQSTENEIDDRTLSSFFPDMSTNGISTQSTEIKPSNSGNLAGAGAGGGDGTKSTRRKLLIKPTENGFELLPGKQYVLGETIEVEVAYAVRNGNSFGEGSRADLELFEKFDAAGSYGVEKVKFDANTISFQFTDMDSKAEFANFDSLRDLSITEKVISNDN